jgi:anaerobic magnesium-protoporphyrin IX monomethyl ester cyclase
MKVLLVDPKRINLETYLIVPHMGLGYIATALRADGHEVAICNAARDSILPDEAAETAAAGGYSLIGISVFTSYLSSVKAYASAIRRRCPNAKIVAGGPHAIFEPEETFRLAPEFDYVVYTEGESTATQLATLLERNPKPGSDELRKIPNLVFRDGAGFTRTYCRITEDIDSLGSPAWDLLRPDIFPLYPNGIFTLRKKIAPIITSRGCPYSCTFCGAGRIMGHKMRLRGPVLVADEIELLRKQYGIREIHFMDDNFSFDRNHATGICEELIRRKLDVVWASTTGIRLDGIDDDLSELMKRSGCYSVAVGIESGSQRVLDLMKKHLKLGIVTERVNVLRRHGIEVTGLFILGLPGETYDEMLSTVRLSLSLDINRANFFNFTPFPGSELYDNLKAEGKLKKLDYDEMYIHNLSYVHDSIDPKKLVRLIRAAHFKFYLRPGIALNLLRKVHSLSQAAIILKRAAKIVSPGKKKLNELSND